MWPDRICTSRSSEILAEGRAVSHGTVTINQAKTALLRWLRLRTWAKAALRQYALHGARFTLLKEGKNQRKLLFRIDSPTRGRFLLRMYKMSRPSENLIPELLWIQALQREMPLSVPEPIPARD